MSIIVRDGTNRWEHAGPENTLEAISAYYRDANYVQLGYNAHPDKDTSVTVTVEVLDEDDGVVDSDEVIVSIPADPSVED